MNLYDFQAIGDTRNARAVEDFYGDDDWTDPEDDAIDEFNAMPAHLLITFVDEHGRETHTRDLLVALRSCADALPDPARTAWKAWERNAIGILIEQWEATR